MNFAEYFLKGLKGTLRFNNGRNLSYKGPWVQILEDTVIDEFYVGDFMSAEYTICVDAGNIQKEIIKCLVVAGPTEASISIYGRTNLGSDQITLSCSVNTSKVTLTATRIEPVIVRAIYSATYYYTINEITPI